MKDGDEVPAESALVLTVGCGIEGKIGGLTLIEKKGRNDGGLLVKREIEEDV